MALFKSNTMTQASGSVGGTTYTRSKSGMVMRARTIPTNPNTGKQQVVRNNLTALVTRWIETLTAAQRNAWNLYALNVPVTNKLGDASTLSGQQWYIAANTPRLQAGAAVVDTAPAIFDRGTFTDPGAIVFDVSAGISGTLTITDAWDLVAGNYMLFYQGIPKNPSVNYFKGPFRFLGSVQGNAAPPATFSFSPATVAANGFVYATGQNNWLQVRVSRVDGRLSSPRIYGPILSVP